MSSQNGREGSKKQEFYTLRMAFIDDACDKANKELNLPAYFVQRTLYMLEEIRKEHGIDRVIEILKKPQEY